MHNRSLIRQELRHKRRKLDLTSQNTSSLLVAQHISQTTLFQEANHIAAYYAHQGELNPLPLLSLAWQTNKNCYLPVLNTQTKTLQFNSYQLADPLIANRYGILEPLENSTLVIDSRKLDLVLVPLVAFDAEGNRLGTGSGYYDRTFAFLQKENRPSKPFLLGVAYAWQQLEKIVAENWDVKLDGVVTENGVALFRKDDNS